MKIERENYAQDAINEFLQYPCVFLLPGSAHRVATAVGSGVIIQTEQNHLAILTAKHIAEETKREEYRLGFFNCTNPISDFVAGILMCLSMGKGGIDWSGKTLMSGEKIGLLICLLPKV